MHLMAGIAVFASMFVFASCNNDDFDLPEVIESEVLDEGISSEISENTTEVGTNLSYETWILVKGTTRAAFEDKVTATLNNQLNNVVSELDVTDWNDGTPTLSFSYKAGESRTDKFVTTTDSILVCTVHYPDFSFDYELVYQVAVYDDGVTKKTMPYYKYENIIDKGGGFSEIETISENGKNYEKRKFTHSIEVTFNGSIYTLTAEFDLFKGRKENKLLSSKVIDGGCEIVSSDETNGKTKSWIEVEQEWSLDGKKTFKVEVELGTLMSYSYEEFDMNIDSKWIDGNMMPLSIAKDSVIVAEKTSGNVEITRWKKKMTITARNLEKENKAMFEMTTVWETDVPVYKDEILVYEMPYVKITNEGYASETPSLEWEERGSVWYCPIAIKYMFYLGEPRWEPTGTDEDRDGLDDITGEEVDYVLRGAVEFSWRYSSNLVYRK